MAKELVRVPDKKYRTIYGGQSTNVCAWCGYHKGCLTVKQLYKQECLKKQCDALVKFTDHPYWEARKNKKLRAKGVVR
jgi:hypothetical protein